MTKDYFIPLMYECKLNLGVGYMTREGFVKAILNIRSEARKAARAKHLPWADLFEVMKTADKLLQIAD